MLPIQEIEITTEKKRHFSVHLEKWAPDCFACKLAALNLGPQLPADATFGPFSQGHSASAAYEALVSGIRSALAKLDASDVIAEVNNPCNTEFIDAASQKQILGANVVVKEGA